LASLHSEKQMKEQVTKIIDAIKKIAEPAAIDKIATAVKDSDEAHVAALASTSKQLATLNGRWGLVKWPMVNPKNIRDKIYVILSENKKHMHFNEIAEAIKASDFKRKDVTTQAIHNELIKDKRFVLIGRGLYALKEWGYQKGTVADIDFRPRGGLVARRRKNDPQRSIFRRDRNGCRGRCKFTSNGGLRWFDGRPRHTRGRTDSKKQGNGGAARNHDFCRTAMEAESSAFLGSDGWATKIRLDQPHMIIVGQTDNVALPAKFPPDAVANWY
jgi:hypothetical protein